MGAARITFKPGGITVQMKTGRVMISQKMGNVIVAQKYFEAPTVPTYDPVYQAWLDRAVILGVTQPSDPEKAIQNQFILDLRSNGLLARMKFGNLYGYGSLGFGNIDIPQPTKSNTPTGSVIYSQGNGIKSNGSSFLTTPFKSMEYAGVETNSTFIAYVSESNLVPVALGVYGITEASGFTVLTPLKAAGSAQSLNYDSNFGANFANTDHKGLYVTTYRPTRTYYKNGAKQTTGNGPVAPADPNAFLLILNSVFGVGYDKFTAAMFVFDQFTDADELAFRTAFNTYKTSIGLP